MAWLHTGRGLIPKTSWATQARFDEGSTVRRGTRGNMFITGEAEGGEYVQNMLCDSLRQYKGCAEKGAGFSFLETGPYKTTTL